MCANILKETPVLSKGSCFLPVTYYVSFYFFSLCSMSLFWYLLQTLKKTCKISHTIVSGKLLAPWFSMKIFILELFSNLDWEFLDWLHSCSGTFLCCCSGFFLHFSYMLELWHLGSQVYHILTGAYSLITFWEKVLWK